MRVNGTAYRTVWMEQGQVKRSRPLCPYPQVARYAGSGSVDDAANFICRDPG